jgi:hypothetical protein
MLGVVHTCHALCMVFCKVNNGHNNYGFLWGRMTNELDNYGKYTPCIFMLVGCIDLSAHNIVDHV